jgi:riboflavin synthase
MFTGIITNTSEVDQANIQSDGLHLLIKKPSGWDDLQLGESIATDGACLTVSQINETSYEVILIAETLNKTYFGKHTPTIVNLERSLKVSDRFGGHYVQGHVDTVGEVSSIAKSDNYLITITFPEKFMALIIPKGSICLNGIALTIVEVLRNSFSVAIIPHTYLHTSISTLQEGSKVNLEFDVIGKYIQRITELNLGSL